MICGTGDRKGQRLQSGPCRGEEGGTGGCLARASESGEQSRELSTGSCTVCFQGGGRHDRESLPQPNPARLVPLLLGQCVPALSPAGTAGADWNEAVQHSTAQGEETGQGDDLQQKLHGLDVSLIFHADVGPCSIFSSHLPLTRADPAGAKPLDGRGGAVLGLLSSVGNTVRPAWGLLESKAAPAVPRPVCQKLDGKLCLQPVRFRLSPAQFRADELQNKLLNHYDLMVPPSAADLE